MALLSRQLSQVDKYKMTTKKYVDLDPSMLANPITKDVGLRQDDRAIKTSVKNLVMTMLYEKPFHSEISSPIKNMLFQNMDGNFDIVVKEAISTLIANYEPRVDVIGVDVNASPDNNSVYITISVMIKNTIKRLEIDVILEKN